MKETVLLDVENETVIFFEYLTGFFKVNLIQFSCRVGLRPSGEKERCYG